MNRTTVVVYRADIESFVALRSHQHDTKAPLRVPQKAVLNFSGFRLPSVFRRISKLSHNRVVVILAGKPEFGLKHRGVGNSRSIPAASKDGYDHQACNYAHGESRHQEAPNSRFGSALRSDADNGCRPGLIDIRRGVDNLRLRRAASR